MKKLFILSSFPPSGLAHRLSYDYNFLMLQMEHKMLMSLGYRTDAVAGDARPLLLLFLLNSFHN